ncbi:MAG TPA: ABC transporter ATP-binding protein [Polyangiaceae bacterium]
MSILARQLVVRYGARVVLDAVDLEVEAGELFVLLGPSGCGKTTLLRAIAGFTPAHSGSIHIAGEEVTRLAPSRRDSGMVFQSFALWPHLSVAENVAFGLRERRVPRDETRARVEQALADVNLAGYGSRRVDELSGGEQQRVALARALVIRPRCLLLDEPLSNLDANLRRSMRDEVRRICKEFGLTTLYVTHDQKEALAIADRLAVMRRGRILQVGTAPEIYRRPSSRAVAAFVGETNLLEGIVLEQSSESVRVSSGVGVLSSTAGASFSAGASVLVSIRPECLRFASGGAADTLEGELLSSTYLGDATLHTVRVAEAELNVQELNPPLRGRARGSRCALSVSPEDVVLLPPADDE